MDPVVPNEGQPVRAPADKALLVAMLVLFFFGLVMVYSASGVTGLREFGADYHFVLRQGIYGAAAVVAMLVVSRIDYAVWRIPLVAWGGIGLTLAGVLACKTPLGLTLNGASRWLHFGPVTVQPAEAMKVALVMWLAYSLSKKGLKIKSFSIGFLPHVIIPALLMGACMLQPDFGTTVVMGLLTFTLLFVAGAKLGYILLAGLVATPVVYFLITGSAYRLARIMAFLDPLSNRFGTGYQLSQSLFGYASGGLWGRGLGDGLQKYLYLPEAYNDFIGAIIGEELGVVGIWVLMGVYAIVVGRGMRIAFRSADPFGRLLAFGLSVLIALQALLNLAVSMGLLPTKGLNLPFVSYGGSALVATMVLGGVLLSISRGTLRPLPEVFEQEAVGGRSSNARVASGTVRPPAHRKPKRSTRR